MKPRSSIFQKIYDIVATIPPGWVVTYGQVGALVGAGVTGRTVGFAMRVAPAERGLPCHRVVNRLGEMAPGYVFGGAVVQRQRLLEEGVVFLPNGKIDLSISLWDFSSPMK